MLSLANAVGSVWVSRCVVAKVQSTRLHSDFPRVEADRCFFFGELAAMADGDRKRADIVVDKSYSTSYLLKCEITVTGQKHVVRLCQPASRQSSVDFFADYFEQASNTQSRVGDE